MKNRNPFVLPMKLHTKRQVFHDRREERGGANNDQPELLEAAVEEKVEECLGLIPGTFIMCGEAGQYCSDACWNDSKEKDE